MHSAADPFDVVIAGAGPAGGLCALLTARAGLRTLLVEKARFPRVKVCGCCLAPAGQAVLERSGLGDLVERLGPSVDRLTVRRGRTAVHLRTPRYRIIGRDVLDSAIVEAARQAGAEFRDGRTAIFEPVGGPARKIRVTLTTDDGRVEHAVAGVAVAADGLAGRSLRGMKGFDWRVRGSSRIGLGAVIDTPSVSMGASDITMAVSSEGYVGAAQLTPGRWVLGASLDRRAVMDSERGADLVARRILASTGIELSCDEVRWRGVPELTRTRAAIETKGNVFAIGDATGYVEPFTGQGMSWAMLSAEAASDCVVRSVRGVYREGEWTRASREMASRDQRGCKLVAATLGSNTLCAVAVGAASMWPKAAERCARWIVGPAPERRFEAAPIVAVGASA